MKRHQIHHVGIGVLLALCAGCATSTTSNTPRTSVEQLLVANAIDQSLDKVSFSNFQGTKVFLQEKYVDCVDKNYLIASTRHRLLASGAELVEAADKADVVVEVRSGAVGTTASNSFIGTPEIALPGMLTIPEIKLAERRRQQAAAKIGFVAFDAKTNQILGSGGISLSNSNDNNWFVAGIGPYQSGSVHKEVHDATTGAAAKPKGHVPATVAFARPQPNQLETETQLAQEPPASGEVSPASHSEVQPPPAADKPAWAQ
jgi:hypothetical protein